jgi:uncharacterized membrane protein (DUF373 family)
MATHPPVDAEAHTPLPSWVTATLNLLEEVLYLVVAAVLVGIAGVVLYHTTYDALSSGLPFADTVTAAIDGVLFVVIILEIFRTVMAHLEGGGFQLRPFLIIGIISAVRHILLVGARSLSAHASTNGFNHTQIELGVNAGVAVVLVVALVLVYRAGPTTDIEEAATGD